MQITSSIILCGLGYMLLIVVCLVLSKWQRSPLPWLWLGLFAAFHRLDCWMETVVVAFLLLATWASSVRCARQSAEKLTASELKYRSLVEGSANIVALFDHEGRFVSINAAGFRGLGIPEGELLGRELHMVWNGSARRQVQDNVAAVLNGEKRSFELDFHRVDGCTLTYHIVLNPVCDPNGQVTAFAGIWTDVSAGKQANQKLQDSLKFVQTLMDAIPHPVFYKDTRGKFLGCNNAFAEYLGVPKEQIRGTTAADFAPPELAEAYRQTDEELLRHPGTRSYETRVSLPDGSNHYVMFHKATFTDPDGNLGGIIGTMLDITDRKRAEERLAALNKCLLSFGPDCRENIDHLLSLCGTLLGGACALYSRVDDHLLITANSWNSPPDFQAVDQAEGHICTDVIRTDSRDVVLIRNLDKTSYAISDPNVGRYGLRTYLGRAVRCDGVSVGSLCVVFQEDYTPSEDDQRILEIAASAIATEEARRKAQDELRASEAKFSKAFRSSPLIVTLSRVSDGELVDISDSFVTAMGYTREEAIGQSTLSLRMWPDEEERNRVLEDIRRQGSIKNRELSFRTKSQKIVWALCSMEIIAISGHQYLLSTAMDITDRKAAEQALVESEFRYRNLFENGSDYILTCDLSGRLTSVNKAAEEAMGYSAANGISVFDVIAPEYQAHVREMMQQKLRGEALDAVYEVEAFDRTGGRRRIEIKSRLLCKNGQPHEIQVTGRDVTERRQFEDALAWEARINSAMAEVSSAVLSMPSMDSMSELVLEHAKRMTSSQDGFVGYIDLRIDCLVCPTLSDDPLSRLYPLGTGTTLSDDDDFHTWILSHRKPVVVNDACMQNPGLSMSGCASPVTNLLCVPAVLEDELLGQIVLANSLREYTEADLSCLERLASLYAIAVKRKRTEDELRIQTSAINATSDQVVITDLQGRIEFVNPAFERETGYGASEIIGQNPRVLQSGKQDPEFYARMWTTISTGETWRGEMVNLYKNGSLAIEDVAITPVKDEKGQLERFVAIKRNITDRKKYEEQLDYLAYHDPLTGLPNRLLFSDRLTHRLSHAKSREEKLAVLFLDIDQFKLINDTLGHNIGDLLLKRVADRLRACLRDVDTIARMGGDEFTVIVLNVQNEENVVSVANRIIESLHEPFQLDDHELFITVSVGISTYPTDGTDVETLVRNADTAMYRAKDRGRNNYQLFTEAFNAADVERMTLEYGLRRALERKEFLLHYQPQVDMKTGQTLGAEALIRWQHPEFGLVPPGKFIPLAEETGLIVPISKWVMYTACAQNKAWQTAGYPSMRVGVNVSARLLHQEDLVQTVYDVLSHTGLDARYLELELTESALMENPDVAIAVLTRIKEMGVKVSVDDFGTGYSSLSYLKRFPIDSVKIDQSFVRDINTNPDDAAIAGAVVAMAHSLKLKVIAEGVETLEQLEFLRSLKCDEIQGYFISRPVPAEDFRMMLEEASGVFSSEGQIKRAA